MKPFRVADLFCGAGGTSTGVSQACRAIGRPMRLVAVNHWARAVETHAANHPDAGHHCEDLTTMDPRKAVPGGKLDLLVASPECTHHSVARGGMPCSDQSRASAWCVLRWATALTIDRIIIENVPEFVSWGPLGVNGLPLKSRRGETFEAFVNALKASGYRTEWKVLNSADYGAATSRRRLFLQAVRGRRQINWPDQTHDVNGAGGLFGKRAKWRGAREIIDWNLRGQSIFNRKRPLSANTLERIEAGLRKFGGVAAEPFLVLLNGGGRQGAGGAKSVEEPCPVVTAGGGHIGIAEPFVIGMEHGGCERQVDRPLHTITTARGGAIGIVEPFLVTANHGADTDGGGHERRSHSLDKPLGTVVAGGKSHAIVQPFILPHRQFDGMQVDDVSQPMRTVTATNGGCNALVQPFTVPYYGTGVADSVEDPLATVTTKDRHGVVEPQSGARLDILFRMLQPHELAAAMGFPAGYKITGNRGEQVKQIGNAVEVNQARALASPYVAEAMGRAAA